MKAEICMKAAIGGKGNDEMILKIPQGGMYLK